MVSGKKNRRRKGYGLVFMSLLIFFSTSSRQTQVSGNSRNGDLSHASFRPYSRACRISEFLSYREARVFDWGAVGARCARLGNAHATVPRGIEVASVRSTQPSAVRATGATGTSRRRRDLTRAGLFLHPRRNWPRTRAPKTNSRKRKTTGTHQTVRHIPLHLLRRLEGCVRRRVFSANHVAVARACAIMSAPGGHVASKFLRLLNICQILLIMDTEDPLGTP